MSKLLTQEELEQIRKFMFMEELTNKLYGHIEALTAELKSTESRLHEVAVACANAEAELARRDALAGEPVGFVSRTSESSAAIQLNGDQHIKDGMAVYAAPPAPVIPNECPDPIYNFVNETFHYDHPRTMSIANDIWNACRAAMLANKEAK